MCPGIGDTISTSNPESLNQNKGRWNQCVTCLTGLFFLEKKMRLIERTFFGDLQASPNYFFPRIRPILTRIMGCCLQPGPVGEKHPPNTFGVCFQQPFKQREPFAFTLARVLGFGFPIRSTKRNRTIPPRIHPGDALGKGFYPPLMAYTTPENWLSAPLKKRDGWEIVFF